MSTKVIKAYKQTGKKIIPVKAANTSVKSNVKQIHVKAADVNNPAVIGTFDGECMDSAITNLNGLDITRDVIDQVLDSDEYRQGLDCGWYIGFLGHPDDPNCMDFRNACIVMTDMSIDESGKVHGKFNLIDTPVGRVVKTFIDAGVVFGISIRGAGDIENNSVDPETFIFRGFDLVSFPAYPESIPTFTEIAASTDAKHRASYKKVCAAVAANIDSINCTETVSVLQSQFAPQSAEFKMLDNRRQVIEASADDTIDLSDSKVEGVTALYLDACQANTALIKENESLRQQIKKDAIAANRRIKTIQRIMSDQLGVVTAGMDSSAAEQSILAAANKRSTDRFRILFDTNTELRSQVASKTIEIGRLVSANSDLAGQLENITAENLIYKQKVNSHAQIISRKDATIAELKSKKPVETVNSARTVTTQTSNRDDEVLETARNEVLAAQQLVQAYQKAYASLYASAVGVGDDLDLSSITASTTITELQSIIGNSSITASQISDVFVEPQVSRFVEDEADEVTFL